MRRRRRRRRRVYGRLSCQTDTWVAHVIRLVRSRRVGEPLFEMIEFELT